MSERTEQSSSLRSRRRIFQGVAVLFATLNAVSDGMHLGWTAPIVPFLLSKDSPIKTTESDVMWLESIAWIGSVVGIPLTIYSVNKFGRKRSILLAASTSFLSWLLIAFTSSVEVLIFARFVGGIGVDVAFVSGPIYIAEIADHEIRGLLGGMEYLMMLTGTLLIYSIGPYVSITASALVGASCIVLQFTTFSFMPESPYYYLIEGNEDAARKSLQRLRCTKVVEEELEEITVAIKRQRSETGRFVDLFLIASNRKAFTIIGVLNVSQQFSGFIVIVMNLHSILGDAATLFDPNIIAIVFSIVMLAACVSAAVIIDRVGRRALLISSSLLTGSSLLVLAIYFEVKSRGISIGSYTWIPMAAVMFYAASYKYGLGMVPIVITGEIFSSSIKAIGMTTSDMTYIVACIASIYLYQLLAINHVGHIAFYVFATCCALTALFSYFYIPETKGKTLEEIQLMLKSPTRRPRDAIKEIQEEIECTNEKMLNT